VSFGAMRFAYCALLTRKKSDGRVGAAIALLKSLGRKLLGRVPANR
jgi:hypothetical protein